MILNFMKNLYILGADSFGRELFNFLKLNPQYNEKYYFKGFLDDRKNILDNYGEEYFLAGDPILITLIEMIIV